MRLTLRSSIARARSSLLSLAACALVALSCDSPTGPAYGAPAAVQMLSGNAQTGRAFDELEAPLVVEVLDARGRRVPLADVRWILVEGAGTLSPASAFTDSAGTARTTLRLTEALGTHRVVATVGTLPSVEFVATAVRRPPRELVIVSGNSQSAIVRKRLADSLVVRAVDDRGTPVPDVTVTFAATTGRATASPATVVTDANGRAAAAVTVGDTVGFFFVTAGTSIADTYVSPGQFQVIALQVPVATIEVLAGDEQVGVVDRFLTDSIRVRLRDPDGAVIAGRAVGGISSGATRYNPQPVLTDANGIAALPWRLGLGAGRQAITVTASGTTVFVHATAMAGPVMTLRVITGQDQDGVVGDALAEPVVVRAVDEFDNRVVGASLAVSTDPGNGSLTPLAAVTDSAGELRMQWQLGATLAGQRARVAAPGGSAVGIRPAGPPPAAVTDSAGELRMQWQLGATLAVQRARVTAPSDSAVVIRAAGTPPVTALGYQVTGADFHRGTNRLVTVSASPHALHLIDPVLRTQQHVALPRAPTSVSISPDGLRAAVGSDGWVTIVDLVSRTVTASHEAGMPVGQVLFAGNGRAYLLAKSPTGSWHPITALDVTTGARAQGTGDVYTEGRARLHPNGESMYVLNLSDFERHDIRGGASVRLYDSRYTNEYGMLYDLFMSDDGSRLFTMGGAVFATADAQADDIRYLTRLDSVLSANWVAESAVAGRTVAVSPYSNNGVGLGEMRVYESTFYNRRGAVPIPRIAVPGGRVPGTGYYTFFSADGASVHVLLWPLPGGIASGPWSLVTYPVSGLP